MRTNQGVEWGAHCAVVLALLPEGATLSAAALAEYHGIPGPYLAKTLQALARNGLVAATPGRHGGYRLAHPADQVTLLDLVRAIEGEEASFRCTEIRKRGPANAPARAYPPVCAVAGAMWEAEAAWQRSLQAVTVADLVAQVGRQAPAVAVSRSIRWLGTRVSLPSPVV
jgi:Rrf2 family protein